MSQTSTATGRFNDSTAHGCIADQMKGQQLAEGDADDDAERHSEGKKALEYTHRGLTRRRVAGRGGGFTHDGEPL
jgi:hypothetical protein